jgi:hypothetical protein
MKIINLNNKDNLYKYVRLHIKTITEVIDELRNAKMNDLADTLQFGIDGRDDGDGHRCQICDELSVGQAHKCWVKL